MHYQLSGAGEHVANDQYSFIFKVCFQGEELKKICTFVNWVFDLLEHRSAVKSDRHRGVC